MEQTEQDQTDQTIFPRSTQAHGRRYSRRQFLIGIATVAAGGVLGACGEEATPRAEARWSDTYPPQILPDAPPPGTPTPIPAPRSGDLSLEQFLALSAVLTGFDVADLNPMIGLVYLQSLQSRSDPQVTLMALYKQAGFTSAAPPTRIEDLQAAGIFDQEPTRSLADTITEYWYTGIYSSGDNQQVATYVDALAWESVTFTKPRSICGPFPGFWREQPPVIP